MDLVRIAQLLFPPTLLLWQILAMVLGAFFVPTPWATLQALLEGVRANRIKWGRSYGYSPCSRPIIRSVTVFRWPQDNRKAMYGLERGAYV